MCAGHARGRADSPLGRLHSLRRYWRRRSPRSSPAALASPRFRVDPALRSALHVGRILPVLLVSAAYLTSTPVRDTRAAVQRLIPGNPAVLGIGIARRPIVPQVLADVREVRDAIHARGGEARPLRDRARLPPFGR